MNRKTIFMCVVPAAVVAFAALLAGSARGQSAPADTAGRAARDSIVAIRPLSTRAAWLSDRFPLNVGDILTVLVDERTSARERVSTVAVGNRGMKASMNAGIGEDARLGPEKGFGTRLDSDSRDVGEANRVGDLSAVLSVRVVAIAPDGVAQVRGTKTVAVDGRLQDVTVDGFVRPDDVRANNTVLSGSIANAVITYKGKKLPPRGSFIGKLLGLVWP